MEEKTKDNEDDEIVFVSHTSEKERKENSLNIAKSKGTVINIKDEEGIIQSKSKKYVKSETQIHDKKLKMDKQTIKETVKNNLDFSFGVFAILLMTFLLIIRNFFSIKDCNQLNVDKIGNIHYINNQINTLQNNSKDSIINNYSSLAINQNYIQRDYSFPNTSFIYKNLTDINPIEYQNITIQIQIAEDLLNAIVNKNKDYNSLQNALNNIQGVNC